MVIVTESSKASVSADVIVKDVKPVISVPSNSAPQPVTDKPSLVPPLTAKVNT